MRQAFHSTPVSLMPASVGARAAVRMAREEHAERIATTLVVATAFAMASALNLLILL
ncbi:hypothetical protein GGD81_001763 [Rhodobium orientis]|uniref:hypothetical protein n=1 Tax=Rhodobium orientis TaxID=34017 RepID=UPI001474ACCC|nr:hypothetical protein [Rhodobium orientis]MBB4302727.1 hypothetical protein [Rhodobium orientis]